MCSNRSNSCICVDLRTRPGHCTKGISMAPILAKTSQGTELESTETLNYLNSLTLLSSLSSLLTICASVSACAEALPTSVCGLMSAEVVAFAKARPRAYGPAGCGGKDDTGGLLDQIPACGRPLPESRRGKLRSFKSPKRVPSRFAHLAFRSRSFAGSCEEAQRRLEGRWHGWHGEPKTRGRGRGRGRGWRRLGSKGVLQEKSCASGWRGFAA